MVFSKIKSIIIDPPLYRLVEVEVLIDERGFPGFYIIGLASKEVSEAKERVKSAIKNCGLKFPNKKIVVNLSPADLPKKGSSYDLPIALGILKASGQLTCETSNILAIGELSLDSHIRAVKEVFLSGRMCLEQDFRLLIPKESVSVLRFFKGLQFIGAEKLSEMVWSLNRNDFTHMGQSELTLQQGYTDQYTQIQGQFFAKRGLQIAASGGHHIYLMGPTGVGKSILSRALHGLLPKMSIPELLEVNAVHSSIGSLTIERPFREPVLQNIDTGVASNKLLKEMILANLGILFLDECLECKKSILEMLKIYLEKGRISRSLHGKETELLCKFILVLASNACPCGNLGEPKKICYCSETQIMAYRGKLSQSMLDRIDLQVICSPSSEDQNIDESSSDTYDEVVFKVERAYQTQLKRYKDDARLNLNSQLDYQNIRKYITLDNQAEEMLSKIRINYRLNQRSTHKILKIGRTIADLGNSEFIKTHHLSEAIRYRFNWTGSREPE